MTTDQIILDDLQSCARQLAKSQRGRSAMRHVLAWLDDDGLGLDEHNQQAVLTLLNAAWGSYSGTAMDVMREALVVNRGEPNEST